MTAHLTVLSSSDVVLHLVSDYARGLGCSSEAAPPASGRGVRIAVPDADQRVVELLTHVALGCVKAGIDVTEPTCELTYHHTGASSQVRLALHVDAFNIESAEAAGHQV